MDQNSKGTKKQKVDCRPYRVEACSMTLDWRGWHKGSQKWGQHRHKSHSLVVVAVAVAAVVAKGDGEGGYRWWCKNHKNQQMHRAPKETKAQFSCEFITAWSPYIQQLGVDTEGSRKILRQGKTNFSRKLQELKLGLCKASLHFLYFFLSSLLPSFLPYWFIRFIATILPFLAFSLACFFLSHFVSTTTTTTTTTKNNYNNNNNTALTTLTTVTTESWPGHVSSKSNCAKCSCHHATA